MARNRKIHSRQPRNEGVDRGSIAQANNAYASLADVDAGNMNSHLFERLGQRCDSYPDPDVVPTAAPPRANNDIRNYFHDSKKPTNAGAWASKPEIPLSTEVLPAREPGFQIGETIIDFSDGNNDSDPDTLEPNKSEGAFNSKEEYLRTHYNFLREDAVRPLREAVDQVRMDPLLDEGEYGQKYGIGIYEPVYVRAMVFSPRGLATRVAFSLSRVKKFVRWDQSKRLITGSLVALSDDLFETTCILAVVAARPLAALQQNPPELDLFFLNPEDTQVDPMKKWLMVESRNSFFEATRHTMTSLQHLVREKFPLSEYLVRADQTVQSPNYVQLQPFYDMSSLVTMEESEAFQNVNILQQWPSTTSHGLDASQSDALKCMLTNRLAIVQGPPGTGKTYVSVVALKLLLANMRPEDPPIIVTCQTNHALDQLLRHVAEFEPNFIRLGGRSKDKDKIKKRTLFEVRSGQPQEKTPGSLKTKSMAKIRGLTHTMQGTLLPLSMNSEEGALSHKILLARHLISPKQAESMEIDGVMGMSGEGKGDSWHMENWVGRCLIPCNHPLLPDDFGMEYEEEDFEIEKVQELEAEAVARDDDDIEALRGPVFALSDKFSGRGTGLSDGEIEKILKEKDDLQKVPAQYRGAIYNYFLRQVKKAIIVDFRGLAIQYAKAVEERKIGQWEEDQRLLQSQRLIGTTTTGLSKYRPLLASLRPRVVLVEEAAETLEAPVAASCLPTLEHLILVGDHQQLRPRCQIRDFEDEPFNFNLSLFERMVLNQVNFITLQRQRRMIPEVRRLLEPIYGKQLKDHASVKDISNRPPIEGMGGCNTFFFTHEWPESQDVYMSCLNEKEADMIVGFIDYLLLNGEDPKRITLLTFYNGQRKLLLKKLRLHQNLQGTQFNVVTVDSYQGEENDIVLLSLVRSNQRHNIGFLSVDNRVCVALSRAKRGLYIFGNGELLACESPTWADVAMIMFDKGKKKTRIGQRRIGYNFPLTCSNHGHKTWIEEPGDWQYINGGCDEVCRCKLPCGHTCMLRCHPFENDRINCTQKCDKRMDTCGHPCDAMCCDSCRCQRCERYGNGMKSLIKPAGMGGQGSSFKVPPMPTGFSIIPSGNSVRSHSTDDWTVYANGGAKVEDEEFMKKTVEEVASFQRTLEACQKMEQLIEVEAPKKASALHSHNTDLLGDLSADGFGSASSKYKFKGKFSYADATNMNLLD
ncbi:P-loop containing nucleoside triphosphate hydrolase protein [Corynespora cassiicola Philippines]|uniref:P-loop containing nucleoside triphosphate hydrolase protein n=1 Tax=Corynespora cassiicola Philippines TaxID=1448308 RepID=A0A2T2P3R2_CORCC|nr:P-loop containing nucleoside triphosphate hydrolase protein [Corynespora cassiicola Philippines]